MDITKAFDTYSLLAFEYLLQGDTERARDMAAQYAQLRDGVVTDAEHAAKLPVWELEQRRA